MYSKKKLKRHTYACNNWLNAHFQRRASYYKIYLNFRLHFFHTLLNLAAAELLLFQLLFCLLPLAAYFSNLHSQSLDTPVNTTKEHTTINIKELGEEDYQGLGD